MFSSNFPGANPSVKLTKKFRRITIWGIVFLFCFIYYLALDPRWRKECLFFPSHDNPTCYPKIPAKFTFPRAADDPEFWFLDRFDSCPKSSENPVILVKSAFDSSSVRYLWRDYAKSIDHQVRFLVGRKYKSDGKLTEFIGETTADIIFGSFNDTYQNLPKKTASAYEYVNKCFKSSPDQEVLLIDDDTFYYPEVKRVPNSINCGFSKLRKTLPVLSGKWVLDEEEWPNKNMFPTYCSGACYSAPASIFMKIHEKEKTLRRPELTLEDLLFVGIYRELAGIEEPVLNHMCKHLRGDVSKLRDMIEYRTKLL